MLSVMDNCSYATLSSVNHHTSTLPEMSPEQQKLLIEIRKRKQELLLEIQQIKDELCEVVAEMEALDSQDDCKHSNKDKQMSIGRKKFNMDPKKGIEYLVENHLLRMDPQDIAHFLYKGEGLNKTAIGDFLGEKSDFNEQVGGILLFSSLK